MCRLSKETAKSNWIVFTEYVPHAIAILTGLFVCYLRGALHTWSESMKRTQKHRRTKSNNKPNYSGLFVHYYVPINIVVWRKTLAHVTHVSTATLVVAGVAEAVLSFLSCARIETSIRMKLDRTNRKERCQRASARVLLDSDNNNYCVRDNGTCVRCR